VSAEARERAIAQNTTALMDAPDPLYALARRLAEHDQRLDRLERRLCTVCGLPLGDVDPHMPGTDGPCHPECCAPCTEGDAA
jgi:hypothetical protein